MTNSAQILDATFWDNNYQTQSTGWDLGSVSPPLSNYIDQLEEKSLSILIPGCGKAYEAAYLLASGFTNITVIDISAVLTASLSNKLQKYIGKELTVITGDFFEHDGQYDLILEQTFFCALSPGLRTNYAQKMFTLLKPEGKLTGLLFDRIFEFQGPPFGGSKNEYEALFAPYFKILKLEACYNSVKPRAGSELFFQLVKNKDK